MISDEPRGGVYPVTRSELETLGTLCQGIVTHDGIEDACGKPATTILYDPDDGPWPACTWHANRYSGALTLAELATCRREGVVWIARDWGEAG